MANGLVRHLEEVKSAPVVLPARDVRARKPLLLRLETGRSIVRVVTLASLDALGLFLAIWTALEVKAAVRDKSDLVLSFHQT